MRGERIENTTKSGPSSARQRNAIEMAYRWRADDGPTLIAGLVVCDFTGSGPVLLRNPIFVIFRWGGGGSTPLKPHIACKQSVEVLLLLTACIRILPLVVMCILLSVW